MLLEFLEMVFDTGVKLEGVALVDAMAVVEGVRAEVMQHGWPDGDEGEDEVGIETESEVESVAGEEE